MFVHSWPHTVWQNRALSGISLDARASDVTFISPVSNIILNTSAVLCLCQMKKEMNSYKIQTPLSQEIVSEVYII